MISHLPPVAVVRKTDSDRCRQGCEPSEVAYTTAGVRDRGLPWRTAWRLLLLLNMVRSHVFQCCTSRFISRRMKADVCQNRCMDFQSSIVQKMDMPMCL